MARRGMAGRLGVVVALVLACGTSPTALAQPSDVISRPASSPAAASTAAGRCGVCHPRERVLFERSRHAQEDIHCVSCHGGDDRTLEQGVAHGSGFRGRPARTAIPALCASCHANEERMRAYNLPVDQYALYQTSGHGRRLARGDTRVAVCSDCHGAHDILPPSDPASHVFALNVPKTCGRCHGDSTLMQPRGRRDAYREYQASVHARELFDKGNPRAPTCVSCHGVHGAAPPQVGDVDKVCGQCHTAERRYFVAGPHREGLTKAGQPECASCHGDHAIQAARPERLSTLCAQCHGEQSQQTRLGRRLWTEYRAAAQEVDRAAAILERAEAVPLQTTDYRARLEEARTYLRESLPAAHGMNEETVSGFTLRARSVSAEIEHEIYGKLGNLRTRKFVLILFWFYVLLTILVLRRFRGRATQAE
jgi:predicted CXXCH cytochrome family protein